MFGGNAPRVPSYSLSALIMLLKKMAKSFDVSPEDTRMTADGEIDDFQHDR